MDRKETATCAFPVDRDLYNRFKGVVIGNGGTVKDALTEYMRSVVENAGKKTEEER